MKVSIQEDMWQVSCKLNASLPGQGDRLIRAIMQFGFTGQEPETSMEPWYFAFLAFRGRVEMSAKQSESAERTNAKRWGKNVGTDSNHESVHTDTDSKPESVHSDTDDAESESESESEKREWRAQVRDATALFVSHLNASCGTSFRASSSATQKLVSGRLKEGYTPDELCEVADGMAARWVHDPKMAQYLRPETLLRPSKFEGYLQAVRSRAPSGMPDLSDFDVPAEEVTVVA